MHELRKLTTSRSASPDRYFRVLDCRLRHVPRGVLICDRVYRVINHFDLLGLRQVWRGFQSKPQTALPFTTPLLYRIVRHPLYVGWLFVFWSTAEMTITHLFFAVMTTGYILVAIQLEERDLMRDHPEYADYRRQTPMLIPRITRPVHNLADNDLRGGPVSA